jgi:hypothetical protein
MSCTAEHWCYCRCEAPTTLISQQQTTYYPTSGILRIGRRLLCSPLFQGKGKHFWYNFVKKPQDSGIKDLIITIDKYSTGYNVILKYDRIYPEFITLRCGILIRAPPFADSNLRFVTPYIWCIQRAVRAFLQHRRRMVQFRNVFAKGIEKSNSVFARLPSELVARCCKFVK